MPGTFSAAMPANADLAFDNRSGGRTWREFLDDRRPARLLEG